MVGRNYLATGLLLAVACNAGTDPGTALQKRSAGDGATVSGVVYGFTPAPDSQRVALAGATVLLVRVGDFVPPGGPDTSETPNPPLPPGPDTMLTTRNLVALVDTVISPPDSTIPPPPDGCGLGVVVATVVTGSNGEWSVTGVETGVYSVRVDPPSASQWRGIEYCGYVVQSEVQDDLALYLPWGPGPDPVP
jgi:hypothetical protein